MPWASQVPVPVLWGMPSNSTKLSTIWLCYRLLSLSDTGLEFKKFIWYLYTIWSKFTRTGSFKLSYKTETIKLFSDWYNNFLVRVFVYDARSVSGDFYYGKEIKQWVWFKFWFNISYRWTQHILAKIIIRVWSVSLLDRTKKPVAECPTLMKRTIIIGNEACVY